MFSCGRLRLAVLVALTVGGLVSLVGASVASANGVALHNGEVLAAIGSGQVKHFDSSGNLLDTLDTSTGATYTTGMCFDSSSNLYVTDFASSEISKFDSGGNLLAATWASGFPGSVESCVPNASNDIYAGGPAQSNIVEYDPTGAQINSYSVATDPTGTSG